MAAAGHVNMMDDVLISNLPPILLRSALRTLLSQGPSTQQPFAAHIRKRLQEAPPPFVDARELFPRPGIVSPACAEYIASARCVFSSKLATEALPYLTHFVNAITAAEAKWALGDDLDKVFDKFSGDIVQAVQALKESKTSTTPELLAFLQALLTSLDDCATYCAGSGLKYPFTRAERQVRDVVRLLYPAVALAPSATHKPISVDPSKRQVEIQTFSVGPYKMPRLFNGLWQLSSPAWGSGSAESQEAALVGLVEDGLGAFDMADHYGDAELVYGDFRTRLPDQIQDKVYVATKWCIFGPLTRPVTADFVLEAVKERSRRLGGRVELLQFHWYDYASREYLDILVELVKTTKSHPELVSTIGLCNFDAEHTEEACEYIFEQIGEVALVSNQVQFSLIDSRPLQKMSAVCEKYGIKLLTYGSFCGGFISPRWLGKQPPEIYSEASQLTPSQRKYFDMLQNWGTWSEFQILLETLASIAKKHGPEISLSNVATRWILQQSSVGAVIVGTRLGVSSHASDNVNVFKFQLDEGDMAAINEMALGKGPDRAKAKAVFNKLGDCGNEYRTVP